MVLTPEEIIAQGRTDTLALERLVACAEPGTWDNHRPTPLLTDEMVHALCRRNDHLSREVLVLYNRGLVWKWMRGYRRVGAKRGLPPEDLEQEGMRGLHKAIGRYDPDKGCKFSTYAGWRIRQCIERAIENSSYPIRIPVSAGAKLRKWRKAITRCGSRELAAEHMGVSREKMEYLDRCEAMLSLDQRVHDGAEWYGLHSHGDVVDQGVSQASLSRSIWRYLGKLSARDRIILVLRFGLGTPAHSLQEVGDVLGVTRENVRQLQGKALRKLEHRIRAGEYEVPKGCRLQDVYV